MVWILQLAPCRHAAQIYRETVLQITALISGLICIESVAATRNNSIQVWQKDFKSSIYEEIISPISLPEFYSPFCFQRSTQSISYGKLHKVQVKKPREVTRHLPCTWKTKEQGGELTVTATGKSHSKKILGKRKYRMSPFPMIKPFLKMCEWQGKLLGFFVSHIKPAQMGT